MKVLHCPQNIGGQAAIMAKYERKLGIDSKCVTLEPHKFGYVPDIQLTQTGASYLAIEIARFKLLKMAVKDYDVIHFNAGASLMPARRPWHIIRKKLGPILAPVYQLYSSALNFRDLPLLKALGKKIIISCQGSDIRPGSFYRDRFPEKILNSIEKVYLDPFYDKIKAQRRQKIEKYADSILCFNPDLVSYFKKKAIFVPYCNVETYEVAVPKRTSSKNDSDPVRIVHAPSHAGIKGTQFIVAAIDQLVEEGYKIDFVLLSDVPHSTVLNCLGAADVFIDQLIVGWYGGAAIEAMSKGIPVICYIDDANEPNVDADMWVDLPILKSDIRSIYKTIRNLLEDGRHSLQIQGKYAKLYSRRWHSADAIVTNLVDHYS